ncbi:MAG: preprotein translocase subunit SecY [Clostridia bacterium]|jgi:preprotein translocase subunit SecY|nr:preprotein translocase subunit SecY [Clostridia bacterium]MBR0436459.1 preprotein translocase subunit SecY [Clostridia bacterium]MBR3130063.1 preprotein translocase subunit SecY [Clostridia bacterium]
MFSTFINAFKIKDLRKKILYTLLLIVVYRLGSAIPIPGVNLVAWGQATERLSAMSDFMSLMSGSAFSQFTIFAMGISPYITASIILQLLTIAIPALEKMSKEEDGRQKIERITRYAGVGLAVVQAIGIVLSYNNALGNGLSIVSGTGWAFALRLIIIAICAAAGTAFLMWLGERITEKGIGNGISMLIFASIVSRVPDFIKERINAIAANPGSVWTWVILVLTIVVILALITFVVYIDKAVRKIPVQYAKRVVGRKMYGGQNTHLPLKANANGVLPLIFAMTIMQFPEMIMQFFKPGGNFMNFWYRWMVSSPKVYADGAYQATSVMKATGVTYTGIQYAPFVYYVVYFLLIIAFGYFYTSITFNPAEMSKNLQQNGGFIPGIRPGKPTGEYLGKISNRLTLFGSLFLAIIAIVPTIILNMMGVTNMFGATSVLIMVSVALETTEQLESQMLMRHYKGFLN